MRARKSADGSLRYTVQIRIKKNGEQVYQESQTFARKQAAQARAKRRETELSEPGAIERAKRSGETMRYRMDRLSTLLSRFGVRASLFHSGKLCGMASYDGADQRGHIHLYLHCSPLEEWAMPANG